MRAAHGLALAAQQPQSAFRVAPLPPTASAATDDTRHWGCSAAEEAAMWEKTEVGLVLLDYDPATQRRLGVAANSAAAKLWGLHREELLARFAAHDVPTMFTDLDAVHHFSAEMAMPLESERVVYVRMCFGGREARRGLLAAFGKDQQYNALGQLCQVHTQFTVLHCFLAFFAGRNAGRCAPVAVILWFCVMTIITENVAMTVSKTRTRRSVHAHERPS